MTKYFAMIDGERKGPYTLPELIDAGVRPDTYIWHKGLDDWERARKDGDICRYFRNKLAGVPMEPLGGENAPAQAEEVPATEEEEQQPSRRMISRMEHFTGPVSDDIIKETPWSDTVPPASYLALSVLVTVLMFFPTGIVAIALSRKCSKAWKSGRHKEAYEYQRSVKMWIGITCCMAMVFYGLLLSRLLF